MSVKSFPRSYFPESTFQTLDHAQRITAISHILGIEYHRFNHDDPDAIERLDTTEMKLQYHCQSIRIIQDIEPWKVFLMAALCDHVDYLKEMREDLSRVYLRQDSEVDEVIWYQPVTKVKMRLSEVSDQAWGAIQLVVLLESYEGNLLSKIPSDAAKLLIGLYNHWLHGVSASWIIDRTVIEEISKCVDLSPHEDLLHDDSYNVYSYVDIVKYLALAHVRNWVIVRTDIGNILSIDMPEIGHTYLYLEKAPDQYIMISSPRHPKLYRYYLQSLDHTLIQYRHLLKSAK